MGIKLFVDGHVFDGEHQGTRSFIKGIYRELAAYPDLQIFIAAKAVKNLEEEFSELKNIVFIKYRSASGLIRLHYEIPLLIRKHKIDYAHFQYLAPFVKNCKFIVTTHDVLFCEYPDEFPFGYRFPRKILFKHSAKRADVLTTVSDFSRRSIQKHFRISRQKIAVVRNGIAEKFFKTYDRASSKQYILSRYGFDKYILYVSRIEPRKNHASLLRAFAELKLHEQGYHLVFLGKQSLKERSLDKLMARLPEKIKKRLFISDAIDNDDLIRFYRAADLFVYPSKAEGFGIPPLEAAALQVPVLCSHSTAMADFDFFKEQQIDPFDYERIKNKLALALQEAPDEQHLTGLSRYIQENYCWKKSAHTLYELIKSNHL